MVSFYLDQNERQRLKIDELEDKLKDQNILQGFMKELLNKNSIYEIIWSITEHVISKLDFSDCVVYLVDYYDKSKLDQIAAYGPKSPTPRQIKSKISIPIGKGIVGSVALSGVAEIISDTSSDKRYIVDDKKRFSEIAVPIFLNNEVIGVIDSEHPEKDYYTEYHKNILEQIATISAHKIHQALEYQKLEKYKNELEKVIHERTKDLKITNLHLERSNSDLEQYAHAVSHDLKEPLNTIKSFIDLIKIKETNLNEQSLKFMDIISDNLDDMKNLLTDLLKLATISGSDTEKKNVDLNKLIFSIENNLASQINHCNITITKTEFPIVFGFETLLKQLFQNLISNAIKFRRKNTPLKINIEYQELEDKHQFKIIDNGIGIDKSNHTKIFKLFTKLNNSSKYTGAGIGLNLCQKIIQKHHGQIQVFSEGENKGTCFQFTLKKYC